MSNIAEPLYRITKIENKIKCSRRMKSVSCQCQFKQPCLQAAPEGKKWRRVPDRWREAVSGACKYHYWQTTVNFILPDEVNKRTWFSWRFSFCCNSFMFRVSVALWTEHEFMRHCVVVKVVSACSLCGGSDCRQRDRSSTVGAATTALSGESCLL